MMSPEHFFKDAPEIRTENRGGTQESSLLETYANSNLVVMLDKQTERGEIETALCVDIDNTFHKRGYEQAMLKLTETATEQQIPIIAITGNGFQNVLSRIKSGELPAFAGIGGSVGTELWILHKNKVTGVQEYRKDTFFEKTLSESLYNRPAIVKKSKQMIKELSLSKPGWQLNFQDPTQEEEYSRNKNAPHQSFKTSFHFFANQNELDLVGKEMQARFPDAYIVICEEINHNRTLAAEAPVKKYCIDILPFGKAGVIQYLSKLVGIKQGVVAGDSGNDIDMLTQSKNLNAVLVGGHTAEAKEGIRRLIKEPKSGHQSFQRITGSDGSERAIYIEPEGSRRQAAESILRAVTILRRANNIKKMRDENQKKRR